MTAQTPTRRSVLTTGVAVAGAAAGTVVLAACGGSDSGTSGSSQNTGAAPAAPSGTTVAALNDIPVGQAKSVTVEGKPAIVARPTETTAACFSAVCPHQGGTVAPDGDHLQCPLHGSQFDTLTGALKRGPAETGLTPIPVKVEGTNVVTA
ncbi:Rieske (2Fe-2S) protein [Amycolatopsis thermophila]|uniref:Nitrite reductase/ring-hydroxylating ferredoxin subunit n=1 Tax=Amycolatopsis thermophila TaxID=206084 RepID=A0ABU0EZL3_9PSEU|nr:Rieske (2Fe-2S) protein [Amycolatopsis thermophila]MDQ0380759.1 nitrite reductase/ring-hydroxylating ferredoxin subunit [Amycolatopsis thermophila]